MADRFANRRRITSLDPETDHAEIMRISSGYEFPWDYVRSLEFALFRTYCVPSISALLARTGEFERRAQKRYDDTALLWRSWSSTATTRRAVGRRCAW